MSERIEVEYIGPFEHHAVVVGGWQVPLLEAQPYQGGNVMLTLDSRYGLELSLTDAERIVPFVANAIAIALGYARHPDPSDEGPLLLSALRPRRLIGITSVETGEVENDDDPFGGDAAR